jgi:Protein of unknown function (DUF4242)
MNMYAIWRRNGWRSLEQLQIAAVRSIEEGGLRGDQLRWIKSYVLDEAAGGLGMVCLYEAVSADALREHAAAAGLPCDEVVEVAAALVGREEPVRTASVPS